MSSRGDEPSPSGEGDEEAEQGEAPAASRQIMQRSKGETPEEKKQRKELVKLAKVCAESLLVCITASSTVGVS